VESKLSVQPGLLNIRDGDGRTPLHRAAQSGNMALLELLIGKGAIVNAENEQGHTPLHFGAFAGQVDALTSLLDHGAWVDHQGHDGSVPLHFAAGQGKLAAIEYLVARGGNLKVANHKGHFPLHWAVQNKHDDVARRINAMYTARPKNAANGKVWPRPKGEGSETGKVDNDSEERAAENKRRGLFYGSDNGTVRSHTVQEIEDKEVTSLLDKHHPGTPF